MGNIRIYTGPPLSMKIEIGVLEKSWFLLRNSPRPLQQRSVAPRRAAASHDGAATGPTRADSCCWLLVALVVATLPQLALFASWIFLLRSPPHRSPKESRLAQSVTIDYCIRSQSGCRSAFALLHSAMHIPDSFPSSLL